MRFWMWFTRAPTSKPCSFIKGKNGKVSSEGRTGSNYDLTAGAGKSAFKVSAAQLAEAEAEAAFRSWQC